MLGFTLPNSIYASAYFIFGFFRFRVYRVLTVARVVARAMCAPLSSEGCLGVQHMVRPLCVACFPAHHPELHSIRV